MAATTSGIRPSTRTQTRAGKLRVRASRAEPAPRATDGSPGTAGSGSGSAEVGEIHRRGAYGGMRRADPPAHTAESHRVRADPPLRAHRPARSRRAPRPRRPIATTSNTHRRPNARRPPGPPPRRAATAAAVTRHPTIDRPPPTPTVSPTAPPHPPRPWSLVVVGDSIPYNHPKDCPGCAGVATRYAAAIERATGRDVASRTCPSTPASASRDSSPSSSRMRSSQRDRRCGHRLDHDRAQQRRLPRLGSRPRRLRDPGRAVPRRPTRRSSRRSSRCAPAGRRPSAR